MTGLSSSRPSASASSTSRSARRSTTRSPRPGSCTSSRTSSANCGGTGEGPWRTSRSEDQRGRSERSGRLGAGGGPVTPCPSVAPPVTAEAPAPSARVTGVDLARGLALLGMFAVHVFDEYTDGGGTLTGYLAAGRSAATFALVAGVSVAFLTGGRRILHGRARRAAA